MEKNGEKKEFTLDNYPDSTWTFVDTRTILKEKGYEPAIHDFSMIDLNTGEDITDDVLTDIGYTFLLVAHRIEEADDSNIDLINEIYDYSVEHGYKSNQAEYTIQGNAIHLLWLQVDMLLSFRTSYDGELVGTVRKPIRITVNIYTSATITEIPKS